MVFDPVGDGHNRAGWIQWFATAAGAPLPNVRSATGHKHGQIEQPFDEDYSGEPADGFPGEQSAFGARQQTVGERRANAAAIEVGYLPVLSARKNEPPAEGIAAVMIDQSDFQQLIE